MRRPATPLSPNVVWQDKRPTATCSSRLTGCRLGGRDQGSAAGCRSIPYFSAGKLTWMLDNLPEVQAARERRNAAAGHAGRVPMRPARRGVRHGSRPPHRACSCSALGRGRTATRGCARSFGVPAESLPRIEDTVGALGTLQPLEPGTGSCRCARASWTSRRRSRARDVSSRAWSRPRTAPASSCSRTPARPRRRPASLLPTVAWRIDGVTEYALDGGVFAAGALLEWMSRHARARRGARQALAALARERGRLGRACGCCPRSPASALPGGGRRHAG